MKYIIGCCAMADVIVTKKVTSSVPARGASTGEIGIAAIVEKPTDEIVTVKNMDEALTKLGGFIAGSSLMYGLRKIFTKLGTATVHISPVEHWTSASDPTSAVGKKALLVVSDGAAVSPKDIFKATVNYKGALGNDYAIEISNVDAVEFTYDIKLLYKTTTIVEAKEVTNADVPALFKGTEVTVIALLGDNKILPKAGKTSLAGGTDAHTGVTSDDYNRALSKLRAKSLDFVLVDSTNLSTQAAAVSLADQIEAVAYLNTPLNSTDAEALTHRGTLNGESGLLFHPHQYEDDAMGTSLTGKVAVPIAYEVVANQIIAFTRVGRRQVAAGMEFGGLTGLGLTSQPDADLLDSTGVNAAVTFTTSDSSAGTYVWDFTTLSKSAEWQDGNRIQLMNYIHKSLVPALRPSLFKPQDPDLWKATETRCDGFMENLWKAGELFGESKSDAYYVQCNSSNNSENDIQAKRMRVKVGYKDKKMVKWIVLEIEVA